MLGKHSISRAPSAAYGLQMLADDRESYAASVLLSVSAEGTSASPFSVHNSLSVSLFSS